MVQRLDQILHGVAEINSLLTTTDRTGQEQPPLLTAQPHPRQIDDPTSSQSQEALVVERSRDYLQIPPGRTTADSVLTWPIWNNKYGPEHLIGSLFRPTEPVRLGSHMTGGGPDLHQQPSVSEASKEQDIFAVPGGLVSLYEERIPALLESFLQNVYTKNPIFDVEELVRHGRRGAEHGLEWDAMSCLTLICCALGSIARPFDECLLIRNQEVHAVALNGGLTSPKENSSATLYAKDLQAGESFFVLACRRLGLLKGGTIIGSQCHFFAGVYLMYTLRPLESWNHFYQASISYQLYVKSLDKPVHGESTFPHLDNSTDANRKQRRFEQSLYWSCFKSECEFRVELPLPQSEIANFEYPNLFPSPPSPVGPVGMSKFSDSTSSTSSPMHNFFDAQYGASLRTFTQLDTFASPPDEEQLLEIRQQSKRLCNEEESWYYYLTEVALRRIGNRIINTFFRQDFTRWASIQPLLSIALEFDAQISSWSAHLPDAMKQYESSGAPPPPAPPFDPLSSSSRARATSRGSSTSDRYSYSSISRELSWATDNRILEMRSWLCMPFLYHLIHFGYPTSSSSFPSNVLNPSLTPPSGPETGPYFPAAECKALRQMISLGISTNVRILSARSLLHRHHGLWFDLRSVVTSSLILLALVRSGHTSLIPGGLEDLLGDFTSYAEARRRGEVVGGKVALALRALEFWADEAPELRRAAAVLRELARETVEMVSARFASAEQGRKL